MNPVVRTGTAMLAAAVMTGCGAKAMPLGTAALAGAAQVASATQVKTLIARGKALQGTDSRSVTERIHIYSLLAHADSDDAADFLRSELAKWESWPDAAQQALEPPLLAALKQLAADDKRSSVEDVPSPALALALEDGTDAELMGTEAARKHGRRFNIWDSIYKFFGVKKRHHKSGGGGGPAPAPAPAGGTDAPALPTA